MKYTFVIFIQLISIFCFAQKGTIVEELKYKTGTTKQITINRGTDTFEVKKYYKSGKLNDSLRFTIVEEKQKLIGTEKIYYQSGKIASIITYGKNDDETITLNYKESGRLASHIIKPTGVSRYYNNNAEVIIQYDENKFDKIVSVPKRYKEGEHLKNTSFPKRITSKKAILSKDNEIIKVQSGALLTLVLKGDTTPVNHCFIEGFSKDSIYYSKFNYTIYDDSIKKFETLTYKKTFAISLNKINTIIYSPTYSKNGALKAYSNYIVGTSLKVMPFLFGILFLNNIQTLAPYYGGSFILGFILTKRSKTLYQSAVPKKYNLKDWKLTPVIK